MHDEASIPSEQQIYSWIEEVFSHGVRRPGYPADLWAEQFCLDRFSEIGLERVRREPVELTHWEPRRATLTVRLDGGDPVDIPCFPLPLAASTAGVDLRLATFDREHPEAVTGAASLYEVSLLRVPYAWYASVATATYDPDGTFEGAAQTLPFGREFQAVMEPSMEAGAAAFLGVLANYPGDSHEYYVPYDAVPRPMPGVWISGSSGARLREMLATGAVEIRLVIDAPQEAIMTSNIVGELPGADDETVIIGSHHDGPWSSAVEDASGIALVLAQATYWTRVPRQQRPHRLIFLLNSGHMYGGAGAEAYCEQHRAELEQTVLEVHLEHMANEFAERDGVLAPTGHPEARWWFTSTNPDLESSVLRAIAAEGMVRSFVLPPTALGPRPTTDGSEFYVKGVPIVNFLTAPFYLFDAMDTLDKIHRSSLVPLTRAAIRIVDSTGRRLGSGDAGGGGLADRVSAAGAGTFPHCSDYLTLRGRYSVIQAYEAGVRQGVIAVSTPNHPARLMGLLLASGAFFAIVGGALYAAMWIVEDQRSSPVNQVAGISFTPDVQIPGTIVLQRVGDAKEFEELSGFKPFVPNYLPEQTQTTAALSLTLPDDQGKRVGRVGFSPVDGVETDGITGPLIVLIEAPGKPGATVDGVLKRITKGNGRALVATIPCGDLVVDVQMYFGPDPAEGEQIVKPYMTKTAVTFLNSVKQQCGN